MEDKGLKNKAVKGTIWSTVERFSTQIVQFVITLIMARMLTPDDYGLIAMLAIFMSLSQVFIDGGFTSALIQRKDRSQTDYSTVFYINLVISLVIYAILYFSAPLIAEFYNKSLLSALLRVYAFNLIINALAAVHKTILTINLDFRTQSKISFFSALISGIIGVIAAYVDLGVWAIVVQSLCMALINVLLSYCWVNWMPNKAFSIKSFHRLFSFGSKLLIASLISSIYDNIYSLVVGKKFSSVDLGYYSRGVSFVSLLSINISSILGKVSFPLLSQIQDDNNRLISIYRKYIEISSFVIFPLMMLLCGCARPMVELLLTSKWLGAVPVIQILSFAYIWNGIITINLSLLKITGRSDLVLRLEFIKKTIAIIILGVSLLFNSLFAVCCGIVFYSFIALILNTYYTGKLFKYGFWAQMKDFGVYIIPSVVILITSLLSSRFIHIPVLSLSVSAIISPCLYLTVSRALNLYGYKEFLSLVKSLVKK